MKKIFLYAAFLGAVISMGAALAKRNSNNSKAITPTSKDSITNHR